MVKSYKCPGCGGELVYEPGSDHLKCFRCSTTVNFGDLEQTDLKVRAQDEAKDRDGSGSLTYECPNCGAALKADEYTASTYCTYCNQPMLIESRFTGEKKPARILPFGFDKKQAQQNFKAWKGNGFLTPSSFKSTATMDKVKGVYVPYWLYSYTVDGDYEAKAEKHTTTKTKTEEEVTIHTFDITRKMETAYENVPADGSGVYPAEELSVLEPYDYTKLKDFIPAYLSGFYADMYEKSGSDLKESVKEAIKADADNAFLEQMRTEYDVVDVTSSDFKFTKEAIEYVMLPVFALNFKYGGKNYPLYMNGESGKIQGELPISKGKVALVFLIGFLVCFLITFILGRVL